MCVLWKNQPDFMFFSPKYIVKIPVKIKIIIVLQETIHYNYMRDIYTKRLRGDHFEIYF
jgi:hypothetical protein